LNYRNEIAGLRAISVIAVILYHANFSFLGGLFSGGFLGVDIFFVISGFLLTRIILNELETKNRFDFYNFFERRGRRIIPVLFFSILLAFPASYYFLLPIDFVKYTESSAAAVAFISNFYFYFSQLDYFDNSFLTKPLLHTWSLGVEIQFYVFLPFVLFFLYRLSKKHLKYFLVGALILSFILYIYLFNLNQRGFMYLPYFHLWEFLTGSVLALDIVKKKKINGLIATLPSIGIVLILLSVFFINIETNWEHTSGLLHSCNQDACRRFLQRFQ